MWVTLWQEVVEVAAVLAMAVMVMDRRNLQLQAKGNRQLQYFDITGLRAWRCLGWRTWCIGVRTYGSTTARLRLLHLHL
jgi:hypothetical protein